MSGETDLNTLIASMTPRLSDEEYVFCCLNTSDFDFVQSLQPLGTFCEQEGTTVILSKAKADEFQMQYSGVFKCITLSIHSSLDAVGLTAAVSSRLAVSNISANVVAAFYHDHIFIASKDADKALHELRCLAQEGI
ncbi:ACT domain-containing protein [Agarilytica rhodophyticola]|uniref:ACT domain-containing protein n=1 Tax=Agarilytica rhodophyticola TaxID=1737490 RepID=UPI000B348005|nr:ACT domain-containing protein [Agarilytica rhodophyticola]